MTVALVTTQAVRTADLSGVVETYYRSSGKGGQHRNKTDSAVRLQHPNGMIVTAAKERSQWQNRQVAWAELERRLTERAQSVSADDQNATRAGQLAERGWTWTEWRDEVVDRTTGKRARMSDLLRGRAFDRMA